METRESCSVAQLHPASPLGNVLHQLDSATELARGVAGSWEANRTQHPLALHTL